jgi:hypothetical protein
VHRNVLQAESRSSRCLADDALRRGIGRRIVRLGGLHFLLRLDLGQRDGQVFERQLPLILRQLFVPLAMQRMAQLSAQMLLAFGDILRAASSFRNA